MAKESGGKPASLDLAGLKTNPSASFVPVHPQTGEPLPFRFDILDAESKRLQERLWNLARKHRGDRKKKKADITYAELDASQVERMQAYIIGCDPVVLDGKEREYSPALIEDIFGREGFEWLTKQVVDFAEEKENFLPSASKT